VKKKTNIEFKFLGRETTDNKNKFKGKREMTNHVKLVATGMRGVKCKKVANHKQCRRWWNVETPNLKPFTNPNLY
jgi:hypothetical protein